MEILLGCSKMILNLIEVSFQTKKMFTVLPQHVLMKKEIRNIAMCYRHKIQLMCVYGACL